MENIYIHIISREVKPQFVIFFLLYFVVSYTYKNKIKLIFSIPNFFYIETKSVRIGIRLDK